MDNKNNEKLELLAKILARDPKIKDLKEQADKENKKK